MDTFSVVLKKYVSILLLIAVFFTAQYARQFAYLQCKLVTMGSIGLQDCDCGQATNIDKLGDDGHPASKNHVHLTLDDFFAKPTPPVQEMTVVLMEQSFTTAYLSNISKGCLNGVDRPPQVA